MVGDMTFQVGEQVLLKVSPIKRVMKLGKKGKLIPCYISSFEILDSVGPMTCMLALPMNLSRVQIVFHVSLIKSIQDIKKPIGFHGIEFGVKEIIRDVKGKSEVRAAIASQGRYRGKPGFYAK
ncbi:hypothetical protein MTR67_034318 [Solanum verrucosum]|uniref:Tf2-1-like SH3-like domain-containing protein n=1 Tax=Solanum verrucosum TaxID=315347 RepID=A0AAF0U821_SOLVR|nr:hypothetical protein MTR67_034318 [Solanum verrucosum]